MSAFLNAALSATASYLAIQDIQLNINDLIVALIKTFAFVFLSFFAYIFIMILVRLSHKTGASLVRFSEQWQPSWLYEPEMTYFWKQDGEYIQLCIKSSDVNETVSNLELSFVLPEIKGLVDENTRGQIEERLLFGKGKVFFPSKENEVANIPSGALIKVPHRIAMIEKGNFFLIPWSNLSAYLPHGRYVYKIQEEFLYKNKSFTRIQKIPFEFTKEGSLIYDEIEF